MSARAAWIGVQLRRLADARAATASTIVLVLATSFLFGVAPRLIEAQSSDALRSTVNSATSDTRNFSVMQSGRLGEGTDPMAIVTANGVQFQEQFPTSVTSLVSAAYTVVDTPRFIPNGLEARTVRLRYLEGADQRVRVISGRLPTGRTGSIPTPAGMRNGSTVFNQPFDAPANLTTFEAALSSASAADLGVKVGDTLALSTDDSDKLVGYSVALIGIQVVGIYETENLNDDFWFADTSLDRPQVRSLGPLSQIDDMTALISGDAYAPLLTETSQSGLPLRYTWRYQVDPARLTATGVPTLLPDLRRMESVFLALRTDDSNSPTHRLDALGPIALQSGLAGLINSYVSSWRTVSETLSVVEVGAGAVALLALGLICLLAGRRRRTSSWLWLSRGASPGQFRVGLLAESLAVVVPPVVVGGAIAVATVPAAPVEPTLIASAAVLVFTVALILWDGSASSRDPSGSGNATMIAMGSRARAAEGGRGIAALTRGATPRRLVFEVAIVLGAVGGAYLLRQRGVGAAGSDVGQTGADPVIAAIPVLIGGAAALVVVRLLPLPLDVLSRLAEKGRGLVAVLALRRATRRSNDRLLLTALLTMAAVWSFAVASISYLDRASTAASWQRAGAAFRVSLQEGALPPDLTLASVPGVEKMAYATQLSGHVAQQGLQVSALALDLADYQVVSARGWPEGMIPGAMLGSAPASAEATAPGSAGSSPAPPTASSGDSIPAIVSTALAQQERLKLGDVVPVVLDGVVARFSVAAILDSFPTLDSGSVWVLAGRDRLAGLLASGLTPTEAFIRADSSAADAITARARYELPGRLILMSRYEVEADLRNAPGFLAVMVGLIVVSLAVAIYGALAVLAALLLAGAERSREAAHLHVLGLSRRQGALLGVLEHGPTSLLMIAAGIALGIALFAFLLPSLGLGTLVGGQIEVGLSIGPQEVGLVAGAVCLVVAVAIGIEALAQSIIEPAAALRRGMD